MTDRFRLGVYSACIPDLIPAEAIVVAKRIGYRGMEWRVAEPVVHPARERPHVLDHNLCTIAPTLEAARELSAMSARAGMTVIGLAPYIEIGDLEMVERTVAMAEIAGAHHVRLRGASLDGRSYAELLASNRSFFREAQSIVHNRPVRLLVELHHGTIAPSASLALNLLDGLDPDCFGVIYDIGNLPIEGFEDYRIGLELLAPWLAHVHVKNVRFAPPVGGNGVWRYVWSPIDSGLVDLGFFMDCLATTAYAGWLCLEDFSMERSGAEKLAYSYNHLSALLESH